MTTASYTVTTPAAAATLSTKERADQVAKLFGRDIWFDVTKAASANYEVTPTGDWKLVEGEEALRQAIIRRIITSPGEWATLPDYGVGARDFVKARNTRANRDALTERIRGQLLRDPRVESVETIEVILTTDTVRIRVIVIPKGRGLRNQPLQASVELS